jgi:SAM-dependent methyltransferase
MPKSTRPASKRRRKRSVGRSLASRADRHALYERSVQDVEADAATLARLYKRFRKKDAAVLREDFCGTGALSVQWAKMGKTRRATGIDLDRPTLDWGLAHHVRTAAADVQRRVELLEANVLDGSGRKADLTCALNFSYSVFKSRDELRHYFRVARECLRPDGMFIIDCWGGPDAIVPEESETDHGDFVYRWDQVRFCPLTHDILCHIHFDFPDGSKISRAFTYDWRFWTVPELREIMAEAGFAKVHALWEKTDADGEETGVYYEPRRVDNQDSWWTYIAAER